MSEPLKPPRAEGVRDELERLRASASLVANPDGFKFDTCSDLLDRILDRQRTGPW